MNDPNKTSPKILMDFYKKICDIHADRLNLALKNLQPNIPFQEEFFKNLDQKYLGDLELLTNRFAKLQDTISSKIFPLILQLLEENIEKLSFLDILNKLEKLEIIPNVQFWREMREISNHITHEYPDDVKLMVTNLNKSIYFIHNLLNFWNKLKKLPQTRRD